MNQYPINLNLRGRLVLVVGGGSVACRKVKELIAAGAEITLVSPAVHDDIAQLVESGLIRYQPRRFKPDDISGCFLVVAATSDRAVNAEVSKHALGANTLINVVDDAELSNFTHPATVRRGDLLLTASTGGKLPAFSKAIRKKLEESFGDEYAEYLELVAELRPLIMNTVEDPLSRKAIFTRLADFSLVGLLAEDKCLLREKIREIVPESLRNYVK